MAALLGANVNTGKTTGTTLAIALTSFAIYRGNLIVVCLCHNALTSITIADNLSNTWTALSGPTTNTITMQKWYSLITNGSASGLTVTITFASSANARAGGALVFSGIDNAALDTNATNVNDSTSPYDCPTTGTLAVADETVCGFGALAGAGTDTIAATSPDLLGTKGGTTGGGTNATVVLTYRFVNATTAVAPQFTDVTSSRTGITGSASFKNAPFPSTQNVLLIGP